MAFRSSTPTPPMLLARVLMASLFIVLGGWRVWGALNGLPLANATLVLSVGELVLGLLLLGGWRLRGVALAAAALMVADALLSHPVWSTRAAALDGQLLHFMKNIALAGGFLLLSATASRK
ncbi:conserved membrane hypothetical protein [Luteimonas sp. 9C]|uniref:DoxX family protein n=1 Tax=Luteimonas sp. 9C TaxID=2653148 RepID=UPI0012F32D93|nr:DoxX family protein [Luteimonas sp. 9C]VXB82084.1 conserved membrane hypothetical protein [Luteimonas sp. 9C]